MKAQFSNGVYPLNGAYLVGNISDTLNMLVQDELLERDDLEGNVDFMGLFNAMAAHVADIVTEEINEWDLVECWNSSKEPSVSNDLIMRPDYLPIEVEVKDAEGLLELWREEYQPDGEIPDGYHMSGFYRTCSDDVWSLEAVLIDLIGDKGVDAVINKGMELVSEFVFD